MPSSIIQHLHLGGASLSYRKKFRLFFTVVAVVLVLGCAKIGVHYFGFEFLELNALLTSGIGGAIFIIGFLLSSILTDYKEAERIPADIRTSIEAIDGDLEAFAEINKEFDLNECRYILLGTLDKLRVGLGHTRDHKDIPPALNELAKLTPIFGRLEGMGMAANFVVRLRATQDILRRSMLRVYQIQRVEFVPSVHVLVQTLVFSIVIMMLFLKTEGDPASAMMFGFISYMFIYALYLIRLLEQPFAKGHGSLDDVSFFLFDELEEKLRGLIGDDATVGGKQKMEA
ncbi:MAG: hypothetical protein KGZ91_21270 [Afipia sp.]|jgi:hypothetical protein|nr:hypothetical protein [Afipia sp.]WIG52669.1 MAG: hypothetical protein OJF48_003588 [Afipia sp.]